MKRVTKGSGNVFADLGFENSQEELTKAELTRRIYLAIKRKELTQVAAGKILGLRQPDVSKLMRGRFTGFSTDRLFSFLRALGKDIEIVIKEKGKNRREAEIRVLAA